MFVAISHNGIPLAQTCSLLHERARYAEVGWTKTMSFVRGRHKAGSVPIISMCTRSIAMRTLGSDRVFLLPAQHDQYAVFAYSFSPSRKQPQGHASSPLRDCLRCEQNPDVMTLYWCKREERTYSFPVLQRFLCSS